MVCHLNTDSFQHLNAAILLATLFIEKYFDWVITIHTIQSQADMVCHLSTDRLQQLEAALPLATSFSESHAEVYGWLDEMEAELKTQGSPGDTLEQVKKQHESLKVKHFSFPLMKTDSIKLRLLFHHASYALLGLSLFLDK